MSLFTWLRRRRKSDDGPSTGDADRHAPEAGEPGAADPLALVTWIAAPESPFGADTLNCTASAESMVAMTSSADVAERFRQLRATTGAHCRGRDPVDAVVVECGLTYPVADQQDGPLFVAQQMEDKWDVYRFGDSLYFARSWTGDLVYRARLAPDRSSVTVRTISARRDVAAAPDAIAVVDFLIKSHVFDLVAPHPLPLDSGIDAGQLALWSFANFGRRGLFGTRADTVALAVVPREDGGVTLSTNRQSGIGNR